MPDGPKAYYLVVACSIVLGLLACQQSGVFWYSSMSLQLLSSLLLELSQLLQKVLAIYILLPIVCNAQNLQPQPDMAT